MSKQYHIRWRKCQKYFYVTHWQKKFLTYLTLYLYTFSLYENASLIIFSAETEYISTRYWYRNIIGISEICGIIEMFRIIEIFGIIEIYWIIEMFGIIEICWISEIFGIIEMFGISEIFGIIEIFEVESFMFE